METKEDVKEITINLSKMFEDEQCQYHILAYTKDGEYRPFFTITFISRGNTEYYYLLNPNHALYAYDDDQR